MSASSAMARQSASAVGPSWHRRSTRAAILEAAREMLLAEGLEATSLVRIAEKTGFSPNTVYAYFIKKNDLAAAIIAEDLANFAKTFGGDFPFATQKCVTQQPDQASPSSPPATTWHEGLSKSMNANLARWDDLLAEEIGGGSRSADANIGGTVSLIMAGLETRLSDIEARSFDHVSAETGEAIQSRIAELSRQLETIEQQIGNRAETAAQSLAGKLDAFEKTQRQTMIELRSLLLDASNRIEVLEREPAGAPATKPAEPADGLPPVPTNTGRAEAGENGAVAASSNDSYCAVARRATLAAHSLASSDETGTGFGYALPKGDFPNNPTRMLLAACLVLGVIVAGVGLVLKAYRPQEPAIAARTLRVPDMIFPAHMAPAIAAVARAQTVEGLAYLNGDAVAKDEKRAMKFLTAAADSGEPVAQYWLATLYEHGVGGNANPQLANRLYEISGQQGNLRAMYKLAVAYAEGWGTAQDYEASARWFLRAAQLGFVNAQYNLGVLYERGLGVPQNLADAYKWYAIAAMQGDKVSSERIDVLASQMGPDDLAAARAAAQEFKPQLQDANANWTPAASRTTPNVPMIP